MSERSNDQAAVRRREREHSGETSKMAPGMHNAHHHHHNRHDSGNSQSIPAKVGNADGGSPVVTFNPKAEASKIIRKEREISKEQKLKRQFSAIARRALLQSRSGRLEKKLDGVSTSLLIEEEVSDEANLISSGDIESNENATPVTEHTNKNFGFDEDDSRLARKNFKRRKRWWDMRGDWHGFYNIMTSSVINVLIFCIPFGIVSAFVKWNPVWIFWLNFISILPLAWILGQATEDVAMWTGDIVGGLINATLGNVVEIIIAIAALKKDLITIIQASLLGSILSNMLLVLGMCFLFGGFQNKVQYFDTSTVQIFGPTLFLACIGVLMPTVFATFANNESGDESSKVKAVSDATAIILGLMYCLYLFYELGGNRKPEIKEEVDDVDMTNGIQSTIHEAETEEPETDTETPDMSIIGSILLLTVVTLLVAMCSEFLVNSIDYLSSSWGLSRDFIGIILLPIVGNAAEHLTAVMVAVKNKMDLAIAVALGSSIQIALFAVPLMVVLGWLFNVSPVPMTLNFQPMNAITFFLGVVIVYFVINNGESNWLKGSLLLGAYAIMSVGFAFVNV